MKNRTDEYWAMVGELAQPPKRLEGSVQRARRRARRTRLMRALGRPAAALAGAAACFVLLVNAFPTFALACSGVPIVRELAAAVAFSPSLSAAVAHDYVQYIGQSQTVDGVTVRLEYAIVDQNQAVFFYSVDGGRFYTSPQLTALDGASIGGYAVSSHSGGYDGSDGLEGMTLSFTAGSSGLPSHFMMEMFFWPEPGLETDGSAQAPDVPIFSEPGEYAPWEDPNVLRFTFEVTLDPGRVVEPVTVQVGRWVELDGQRILVDRLECTPTRTVMYLGEDAGNTAWLKSLKFWFEDEAGLRYDNSEGGLTASGEELQTGSKSFLTYYFQSFYYDLPQELTLCIHKAEWLDKDAPHIFLDLDTGVCPGLPEGVRVDSVTRTGDSVEVKLLGPLERREFGQILGGCYWDPEGGEYTFNQWGAGYEEDEQGERRWSYELLYLWDYPWDRVELELSYTAVSEYRQPVYVPLTPQG